VDDLDANLFGTKNVPKFDVLKKPDTISASHRELPLKSFEATAATKNSAPIPVKNKKSDLLSELFGADDEDSGDNFRDESLQFKPKSPSPATNFKLDAPLKTVNVAKTSTVIVTEDKNNDSLSGSYFPLSGERRKRNFQRNKPVDDLWNEFIMPGTQQEMKEKILDTKDVPAAGKAIFETSPRATDNFLETHKRQYENATEKTINSVPSATPKSLDLHKDEIERIVLALIAEKQEAFMIDVEEKLQRQVQQLNEENARLGEEIISLNEKVHAQEEAIEVRF
jgi:hypothetical protein